MILILFITIVLNALSDNKIEIYSNDKDELFKGYTQMALT